METFDKIKAIIMEELDKEADEVQLTTTFEDLDADSLDFFQIINLIEEEFDIKFESEDQLKTVEDVVKYVDGQLVK